MPDLTFPRPCAICGTVLESEHKAGTVTVTAARHSREDYCCLGQCVWTPETVKEELPDVTVKSLASGKVWENCRLAGRLTNAGRAYLPDGRHFDFAWPTIASALTSGKPLLI